MTNTSGERVLKRQGSERFKVIGKVVMAMQRFQASINPTYACGKRPGDEAAREAALRDAHTQVMGQQRKASGRTTYDRTASGRTYSGKPTIAGQAHGHKGNLLFRPLPEVPTEAQ